MEGVYNYYSEQLEKLPKSGMITVQYHCEGTKTNFMDLNIDSIPIFIKFLQSKQKEYKSKKVKTNGHK